MQTDSKLKPSIGADNNALIALLSINLVVYAIIGFLKVVYYLKDRKSTRLNSSHSQQSRMPSSA